MFLVELLNAIKEPLAEMDQRLFFIGSVLPGTLVFLALAGVGLARRKRTAPWPAWLPALLFAGAFVFAFASVHALNSVEFWPRDGAKRIFHSVLLAGAIGALAEILPERVRWLRAPLLLLALLGAIALPLLPAIEMKDASFTLLFIASVLACLLLTSALSATHAIDPGWRVPLLATSAPFAASFVAYYGSVASLGQMAGGLTAILSAGAVACMLIRTGAFRFTGWLTLMTPVVIALAGARLYAYTPGPIWATVLALAAPLPAILALPYKLRTRHPWLLLAAQCALTGAMMFGAIWIAYQGRSTYEY